MKLMIYLMHVQLLVMSVWFWVALFVGNWKTGWACEQLCRLMVSTAQ